MTLFLATYRKRNDFAMDELVALAGECIQRAALSQGRWKVTQKPDARTIRYYISTGLLPKPLTYLGPAAQFGYRHLLTLLAIKTLQARFLPLQKVREVLAPLDERGLEAIVKQGVPESPQGIVLARREVESATEPTRSQRKRGGSAPSTRGGPQPGPLLFADLAASGPDAATWERLQIEPGLELQIRSDYVGATGPSGLNAVLSKIRVLVQARQARQVDPKSSEDRPSPPRQK